MIKVMILNMNVLISSPVMSVKLSLDRDFTRFLHDRTFPHKVTVCFGEEQLNCSGAVLAQQSSVLEHKLREDNGVLMFEEFLDVPDSFHALSRCIEYLHGADLDFDADSLDVVLKFASLYEVEDLFEKAVKWLVNYLYTSQSARSAVHFLKIASDLSEDYCSRITQDVSQFIRFNSRLFKADCDDILQSGITGSVMIFLMNEIPGMMGNLLIKWTAFSNDNREFILKNRSKVDLSKIFSQIRRFELFIDSILSKELSNESLRALVGLQRSYFIPRSRSQESEMSNCNSSFHDLEFAVYNPPAYNSPQVNESVEQVNPSIYDHKVPKTEVPQLLENQILVRNLPSHAEEAMIRKVIKYGPIRNIEISSVHHGPWEHGKYAIITFKKSKTAEDLWRKHLKKPFDYDGYTLDILNNTDVAQWYY